MRNAFLLLTINALTASPALMAQQSSTERTSTWPDGAMKERYTVDDRGDKNGQLEQWAANGTRTLLETYVHGHLQGPHLEWTDKGTPVCSLVFQNDQLHGFCTTYHADGRPATTGQFRDGKRTGKWTEVDASGDRRRVAEYRDGLLHGALRIYQKAHVLTRQTWKQGQLIELDDLTPFPIARDELMQQLQKTLAEPCPANTEDAKWALRHAALLRLRAYRQLCGLPQQDMVLWPQWNVLCDAAAEVCHQNGEINHTPPQPPGMDAVRYRQGCEGARNSNLAVGGSVVDSVDNYMDDSDPSNIDRIGHRRWCLNPTMKRVAFGTDDGFHAMWSMDSSGKAPKGNDAVYYPPRGYVPVDLFSAERAFSIATRGGAPRSDDLHATITPLDDDYLPGEALQLDALHVAAGGFGTGACIVFRAEHLVVAAGKRYLVDVSIDGGKTSEHRYVVEFCEPVVAPDK